MRKRKFMLQLALLTLVSITAAAQETQSIGVAPYNSPAAQRMHQLTGIRAACPPVPLYYNDRAHVQVVYWVELSEEAETDDRLQVANAVQKAVRQSPRAYTKVLTNNEWFDVNYKHEINRGDADTDMLRNAVHPMKGQVYDIVGADRFEQQSREYQKLFWLFADEYLSLRRPLNVTVIPDDDDSRQALPETVVRQMEKQYGCKAERTRVTCLIGDDYAAGHIQFAPKGGKCLAVEVVYGGDNVWSYSEEAMALKDDGHDVYTWHADDDGEYFGVQPEAAFDGPDGLEILYFEYAPESTSFGYLTLGSGHKLVNHLIEGYYVYPEAAVENQHSKEYITERLNLIWSHHHYVPFDPETVESAYADLPNCDSLYCSTRYRQLDGEASAISRRVDDIYIDADHWVQGQDISEDFSYRVVDIRNLTETTATAEMVIHNYSDQRLVLDLVFERGDWFIDDFHSFYDGPEHDADGNAIPGTEGIHELSELQEIRNFIERYKQK